MPAPKSSIVFRSDRIAAASPAELLDVFFEKAPLAILLLDEAARVMRANQEFLRLFGYSRKDVIGAPISSLIMSPELRRESDFLSKSICEGETIRIDSWCAREGGKRIPR
jgi:PAS domain S-box